MSDGNNLPSGDRVALVTGASRGIGAAIARKLGAQGMKLILLARTVGGLEETDDAIRQSGGPPAVLVPHDLQEHDGLDRLGASHINRTNDADQRREGT